MIQFKQSDGNINFNDEVAIKTIKEAKEKLHIIRTQIEIEGGTFYLESIKGFLNIGWKNFSPQLSKTIQGILS